MLQNDCVTVYLKILLQDVTLPPQILTFSVHEMINK